MDAGLLFSTGKATGAEIAAIAGAPDWGALPPDDLRRSMAVALQTREVEWFAFDGRIYRAGTNRRGRATT